jgi:putative ABC transport system permease protein
MMRYADEDQYTQLVAKTSSANLLSVNAFMKEEWKRVSPSTLYTGKYTDGNLRTAQMININTVNIFGFFGVIAILMSATGLFAMVSLSTLKKMKEIGVRKLLGASAGQIASVINREFVIILSIASLIGGTLGYLATNKIMDAIWEYFQRTNTVTLIIAISSLFIVAAITVSFKTIVTAFMNPVKALKEE